MNCLKVIGPNCQATTADVFRCKPFFSLQQKKTFIQFSSCHFVCKTLLIQGQVLVVLFPNVDTNEQFLMNWWSPLRCNLEPTLHWKKRGDSANPMDFEQFLLLNSFSQFHCFGTSLKMHTGLLYKGVVGKSLNCF
jgi:hypothetical protein